MAGYFDDILSSSDGGYFGDLVQQPPQAQPVVPPDGGLIPAVKQTIGQTIKGAGQLAADVIPGVSQDNAVSQYGQGVIDANPTVVRGFRDLVDKPFTAVKEAVGNALPSIGGALGLRAAGQAITAAAPLTGPAAPFVAGAGQVVSWAGPLVAAALPSYGGIREKQIEQNPEATTSAADKAIALLGAGTVGFIEQKFGPQDWAAKLATKEGRETVAKMMASATARGAAVKGAVKGATIEGAEELVQNPVEQIASYQNPLTPESLEETAFGGVMGALGGGAVGGGFGFAGKKMDDSITAERQRTNDRVATETLGTLTGLPVSVKDGVATVQEEASSFTVPVETLADHLKNGGTVDDLPQNPVFQRKTFTRAEPATISQDQFIENEVWRGAYNQAKAQVGAGFRQNAVGTAPYQQEATLEDVEARAFAEDARLVVQRQNAPGATEALQAKSEENNAWYAQERAAQLANQDNLRNIQDGRSFTGKAFAQGKMATTEDTSRVQAREGFTNYQPAVPGSAPEVITNEGKPFASASAAIGAGARQDGTLTYEAVSHGDGFAAKALTAEELAGAFSKQDGSGFATPKALEQVAAKQGVDLTNHRIATTSKGVLAVPIIQTQEGGGNELTGTGVSDQGQAELGERAVADEGARLRAGNLSGPSEAGSTAARTGDAGSVLSSDVAPDISSNLRELGQTEQPPTTPALQDRTQKNSGELIAPAARTLQSTQPQEVQNGQEGQREGRQGLLNEPGQETAPAPQTFATERAFQSYLTRNNLKEADLNVERKDGNVTILPPPVQPVMTAASKSAANGYIRRNKLEGTHEAVQNGEKWDVVARPEVFNSLEAPVVSTTADTQQDAINFVVKNNLQKTHTVVPTVDGRFIAVPRTTSLGALLSQVRTSANDVTQRLGELFSQVVAKSKLDIKVNIVHGASTGKFNATRREITIGDPSQLETSLHEIVHAVTVNELRSNPAMQRRMAALVSRVKEAVIKQGIISKKQMAAIERTSSSTGFKTQFPSGTLLGVREIAYALSNDYEFLAQAFSSPQFQQLLKSIEIKDQGVLRSAWDALIDKVMQVLGIASEQRTAFSETISIAAQLAAQEEVTSSPEQVFESLDASLKAGQDQIKQAIDAIASPKSALHNLYVQHAPKWLAVTPLRTLVQTFGKAIPQIKNFSDHLDAVVSTKTALVDDAKVLYDKAKDLAEQGPGVQTLNWAAAVASFNRMTPWKSLTEQDWVSQGKPKGEALIEARTKWETSGMKKATGKTYDAAYKQAVEAYNALGSEDLKEAYQRIVNHLGALRLREKNNLLAYIERVSKDNPDLRSELMTRFNASFSTLHGAYWPLSRVGDFRLEYTDSEGFRTVKHYTTLAERRADMAYLTEQGAKDFKESFKDKRPRSEVAVPSMLMDQLSGAVLEKYMEGIDPSDEVRVANARAAAQEVVDDMNQIWLRWQPETSALSNSIRRGNVKGFHEDSLRSYLDYTSRHASNIAWTEQGRKIETDLASLAEDISTKSKEAGSDTTLNNMILNDLRNRINALRTVRIGGAASFLGKLGTAYYMTSPSIALVQMSQLGALTLPKLAVKYGAGKAGKALMAGTKAAFTRAFTRDAMFADVAVNAVYDDLHKVVTAENRGLPQAKDKELGDDLYSPAEKLRMVSRLNDYQKKLLVLREAMARNLLDISAAHEAFELTQGKNPDSLRAKAFRYAMLPMSLSELTSRKATILSTYDLAVAEGKNFFSAMDDIGEVVNDTLYSYAKENKPVALQGGTARVLAQFQWYRIMTAIRLAQLFNNAIRGESAEVKTAARKEFAGIMGMTTLLAGVLGTPLGMVFSALSLADGDDEPEDYELLFQNWLRENFGETGANVVAKGLPTLAGMDLSKRLGLRDIYGSQAEPPSNLHGRDLAAWYAGSLLGPTWSIGAGFLEGYDQMANKGNYLRGLEAATPKPIKDALKAYRLGTEGLKTGAGKKLLADEKIGPDELIMQALGFSTDEVAAAQSANASLTKLSTAISERRGRLIKDAAQAVLTGDPESSLAAIRTWNAKNPRFAVGGKDIRPAIRRIVRGETGVTGVRERAVADVFDIPVYLE